MDYHELSFKEASDVMGRPAHRLILDGQETDYLLNGDALKASAEKDGVYPLVRCECREMGCGGMYVSSRIERDDVVWERFWDGQSGVEPEKELREFAFVKDSARGPNLIVKPPLRFRLDEYRDIASMSCETVVDRCATFAKCPACGREEDIDANYPNCVHCCDCGWTACEYTELELEEQARAKGMTIRYRARK